MPNIKTIKLPNGQECLVESLREWMNYRIASLRQIIRLSKQYGAPPERNANYEGRLTELLIIREKLNDGRIQEIG